MTYIPLIIPQTRTREVECIVQDGTKYCEKTELTRSDINHLGLLLIVTALWMFTVGYFLVEKDKPSIAFIIFLLPPILMLLV